MLDGEVLDDDFMVAYDFYIKKYSNGIPYEVFKKNFIRHNRIYY